jgi:hypothetical protein
MGNMSVDRSIQLALGPGAIPVHENKSFFREDAFSVYLSFSRYTCSPTIKLNASSIRCKRVRQVDYVLKSQQTIYNKHNEYRRIIRILRNGRLAGLINFDSIIEDTRRAEKTPSRKSIEERLFAAVNQFRGDWWRDQPRYVEGGLRKGPSAVCST